MDMAFDLENASSARREGEGERFSAHPRWSDLLSRLVTAREASHSLAKQFLPKFAVESGSFDGATALRLSAYRADARRVNPNALGNRKRGEDTIIYVAGPTSTGGRG